MRVSVIGAGYVGLVTGACLAQMGHRVTLLETDPDRLRALLRGAIPFHEPGLQDVFAAGLADASISATSDPADAFADAELILACVGTPLRADGDADLSQGEAACHAVAEHAPETPLMVRSTLPLGSTAHLGAWLGRPELDDVVTNPEFLRQGTAVRDFLKPTRVVLGTRDGHPSALTDMVAAMYHGVDAPMIITDFVSAEMIKNAANAFLATKLSFINEVADLCEAYEADVDAVVEGIGLDPRIGATYLRPGIGFGGSCLPKELANMVRLGQRRGMAMPLMHGAAQTNDGRATRIVDRLEELLRPVHGCRIALLGLSFKPDTYDLRYSPSLAVADVLAARGATVIGHDPAVPVAATSGSAIFRAGTPSEVVAAADLVILGTEWPLYATLDWSGLAARAARPILYDGRNVLDHEALRAAGWRVIAVGRHEEAADGAEAPAATLS